MAAPWSVQVPVSELARLEKLPDEMDALRKDNARLREQFNALQNNFYLLMERFRELKEDARVMK